MSALIFVGLGLGGTIADVIMLGMAQGLPIDMADAPVGIGHRTVVADLRLPDQIIAGDTVNFPVTVSDYPPEDGYTLYFVLVPQSDASLSPLTFAAVANESDYQVQVSSLITADWLPGIYSWISWVQHTSGQRYSTETGTTTIVANPRTAAVLDIRTHARKMLDAIEATLEGRATLDQQSYTIGNRSLTRIPIRELMELRNYYSAKAATEVAKKAGWSGVSYWRPGRA